MKPMPESIRELRRLRVLEDIDWHLAGMVRRVAPDADGNVLLAAAMASREVRRGHACFVLAADPAGVFPELCADNAGARAILPEFPAADEWGKMLAAAGNAVTVVEAGRTRRDLRDLRPLVLDAQGGRLYLARYWQYEQQVARGLAGRARRIDAHAWPDELGRMLLELFPGTDADGVDRQRLAAFAALRNRLTVIIGGPGTGKTYTVARILALLLAAHDGEQPLVVRLAAPTGKAAMRLVESMRCARDELDLSEAVKSGIPDSASTIERLLGYRPGSPYFRHNASNPLAADVLIVDEASMIDLPRMAKMIDALADNTRLILLGDMNQLASVEAGCVLGDICRAAGVDSFSSAVKHEYEAVTGFAVQESDLAWDGRGGLGDSVVELCFNHRFAARGSVAGLSNAVCRAGTREAVESAWRMLTGCRSGADTLRWFDPGEGIVDKDGDPLPEFSSAVMDGFGAYLAADTPEQAFVALEKFRVLCALRSGPCGVRQINRVVELILAGNNRDADRSLPFNRLSPGGRFYNRRVIMITRNDYQLGLFNGDVGIVFEEALNDGRVRTSVCFQTRARDGRPGIRRVLPGMLPEHETAFAMTIHKSQGSEFGKVLVVMPRFQVPVVTRELLYTAITRARHAVDLWCGEDVFKAAVARRTERSSGLFEALLQ